jgi:glycerol kinase
LIWDRTTGVPVHNAVVWQDTRTDRLVAHFSRTGAQDRLRARTGRSQPISQASSCAGSSTTSRARE